MRSFLAGLSILCALGFASSSYANPPESWFLFDDVLSLKRAEDVIEITREYFWVNAKLPDGKPITPKDDVERATTPIEKMDALYFAQAAQLAGLAMWCDLDPMPYSKHALNAAWSKYRDIRQVIFASMLFGTIARDIKQRKSGRGQCSPVDRAATEKSIRFVMEKSNPEVKRDAPTSGVPLTSAR